VELKKELLRRNLPLKDIHQFHEEITRITGEPRPIEFDDEVVALIEYRDGSIIDVVRRVHE
jgi:citrate lyase subunit alpha/citrate CoA-transferase